jgi:hypothetical protein
MNMTAKRKVPTCSCGLCGYLGRNPGEGVKLGGTSRKADENHSLSHRIKSNQSTLAAKRTVKKSYEYKSRNPPRGHRFSILDLMRGATQDNMGREGMPCLRKQEEHSEILS